MTYELLDGQTVEHYHSEAGSAARMKAIEMAVALKGCYPPDCGHSECTPIRDFMATREFTGR